MKVLFTLFISLLPSYLFAQEVNSQNAREYNWQQDPRINAKTIKSILTSLNTVDQEVREQIGDFSLVMSSLTDRFQLLNLGLVPNSQYMRVEQTKRTLAILRVSFTGQDNPNDRTLYVMANANIDHHMFNGIARSVYTNDELQVSHYHYLRMYRVQLRYNSNLGIYMAGEANFLDTRSAIHLVNTLAIGLGFHLDDYFNIYTSVGAGLANNFVEIPGFETVTMDVVPHAHSILEVNF